MIDAGDKHHLVLTPDGPRGPRREVKKGIAFLASHSGRPIIPTAYACRSCWRVRGNWTDLMIPRPFTTVYFLTGNAIDIPPKLSKPQLAHYTQIAQDAMDRLQADADRLAAGDGPVEVNTKAAA